MDAQLCRGLECVFINACNVFQSLGMAIHDAFPHITVIAYSTRVADKAATAFASGFDSLSR